MFGFLVPNDEILFLFVWIHVIRSNIILNDPAPLVLFNIRKNQFLATDFLILIL